MMSAFSDAAGEQPAQRGRPELRVGRTLAFAPIRTRRTTVAREASGLSAGRRWPGTRRFGLHLAHLLSSGTSSSTTMLPERRYYTYVDTHRSTIPSDDEFESAVGVLKLLGDETRLRILWALLHGEHSVNDLAAHVGAQPAGVSQHLAKLRLSRLVRTRRHGTRIFYVVENAHVRRLVEEAISHVDHVIQGIPGHDGSTATGTAEVDRRGA